jgi:hypothetical protein
MGDGRRANSPQNKLGKKINTNAISVKLRSDVKENPSSLWRYEYNSE